MEGYQVYGCMHLIIIIIIQLNSKSSASVHGGGTLSHLKPLLLQYTLNLPGLLFVGYLALFL